MYSVSLAVSSRTGQGRSAVVSPAVPGITTLVASALLSLTRSAYAAGGGPGHRAPRLWTAAYDGRVTTMDPRPAAESPEHAPATGRRRVLLAAPRGYCAGVDRAVVAVEKALEHYGPPVYVRKQIVHNKHVVETLERRGAIFVDDTDQVPEGELVIFSAHGVAPSVHERAEARGLRTIDATCPLVTKV